MIDLAALREAYAALLWRRSLLEKYQQPVPPTVEHAIEHLAEALTMSANGHEPEAAVHNWLTVAQAAQETGYSERHIRRIAPQLGGRKNGRDWLLPKETP